MFRSFDPKVHGCPNMHFHAEERHSLSKSRQWENKQWGSKTNL